MSIITREFESSSSDARYTAQFDPATGEGSCNCPAWRFVKPGKARDCKHLRDLRLAHVESITEPREFQTLTNPVTGLQHAVTANGVETHAETVVRANTACPVKPMLASAMTAIRFEDVCTDDWVLEEKFDGHRVIVRKDGQDITAWSRPRAGKDAIVRSLPEAVVTALCFMPNGVYDGELVTPGGRSWDVARLDTRKVLVLFDVIEVLGYSVVDQSWEQRRGMLMVAEEHAVQQWPATLGEMPLRLTNPEPVCHEAVDAIWARGGEGAIIKRRLARYQPGRRSSDWLKVKRAASAVLTITGFEAGKLGPYAVTCLRHADGRETTVKTLDNDTMADIAKNPARYIGQKLVIAYCELTDTGSFRHGMWKDVEWDHLAGPGEVR